MKRFKFRLEKILTHRTQVRDECKRVVQALRAECHALEEQISALTKELLADEIASGVNILAQQLRIHAAYVVRLHDEIDQTKERLANKSKELDEATARYVEASKELKAVDLLKERKLQQFNEQVLKDEGEMLDEMSTLRYGRNG